MKQIPLTRGYFALVDDEDYDSLIKFKWNCQVVKGSDRLYAYRANKNEITGRRVPVSMHRQIMGVTDPKVDVDHWDTYGLNNQKHNLRVCSRSQNNGNMRRPKDNTSGYKGVSFDKKRRLWRAYLKGRSLGRFSEIGEAALAYNAAAIGLWGEYARLNDV